MPGPIERKYTPAQRQAVAHAVVDRALGPADVQRLAAAGELEHHGDRLPAFDMPQGTISALAYRLRKSRVSDDISELAKLPPADAIERLRRDLVHVAQRESAALKRKRAGTVDPERLRQLARAVREIAALPGPTDPTPPAPGARVNGQQTGGQTRGGLAGPLLADHRADHGRGNAQDTTAPTQHPPLDEPGHDGTDTRSANHDHDPTHHAPHHDHDDGSPGAPIRALAARVLPTG